MLPDLYEAAGHQLRPVLTLRKRVVGPPVEPRVDHVGDVLITSERKKRRVKGHLFFSELEKMP